MTLFPPSLYCYLNILYPNTNDTKLEQKDISDITDIKNILNKKYIDSYVKAYSENDYYMLVSKSTSRLEFDLRSPQTPLVLSPLNLATNPAKSPASSASRTSCIRFR